MNTSNWVEVFGHWECTVFLDTPSSSGIGGSKQASTSSSGVVLPQLLCQHCHFYSCSSLPSDNMLFRINDLGNDLFVSLFF
jgi:hypothetical protein